LDFISIHADQVKTIPEKAPHCSRKSITMTFKVTNVYW
jgi:hypothetical protein